MLNIVDGPRIYLVVGLFRNRGTEMSFDGQHVLAHFVQDHHVKWDSKNGKDHTKHLTRHCTRADVPVAFAEQNSSHSQSQWQSKNYIF